MVIQGSSSIPPTLGVKNGMGASFIMGKEYNNDPT